MAFWDNLFSKRETDTSLSGDETESFTPELNAEQEINADFECPENDESEETVNVDDLVKELYPDTFEEKAFRHHEVDPEGRIISASANLKLANEGEKTDRMNIFGKEFGGTEDMSELLGSYQETQEAYDELKKVWSDALKDGKEVSVDMKAVYEETGSEAAMVIGSYVISDKTEGEEVSPDENESHREFFVINAPEEKYSFGESGRELLRAAGHVGAAVAESVLESVFGQSFTEIFDVEKVAKIGVHFIAIVQAYVQRMSEKVDGTECLGIDPDAQLAKSVIEHKLGIMEAASDVDHVYGDFDDKVIHLSKAIDCLIASFKADEREPFDDSDAKE